MVRKRTEAFFEKGSLYQYQPEILKVDVPLYSKEDIHFAVEEAERNDFSPFLLKKALKFLKRDDVFMLVEIRRFRFDYCLLNSESGGVSAGKYFIKHIKNNYPFKRIS